MDSADRTITTPEPDPTCSRAPTMMIEEMALVIAISGVCKRVRNAPDHVESDKHGQHKDDEMLHEAAGAIVPTARRQECRRPAASMPFG